MPKLRKELQVELMKLGYEVYKIGGEPHLTISSIHGGYVEINSTYIDWRKTGHGTLIKNKKYETFEKLVEILNEFGARAKIEGSIKKVELTNQFIYRIVEIYKNTIM